MSPASERRERLLDLLAARATEALSAEERSELDALILEFPDVDVDQFDLAAAALEVSRPAADETLPHDLRRRLLDRNPHRSARESRAAPPRRERGALAWGVAAAAVAALLLLMLPPRSVQPEHGRQALLAAAQTLQLNWTATEDELSRSGASGDVVWNNRRQQGYMRFDGLTANDPGVGQYQLWIFDRAQDERFPVDGGVFDVRPGEPTIVAIDAKLEIKDPYLFAITYEKPGGVVVSSRERLVLLAQTEG